jgi:hypothetical protein
MRQLISCVALLVISVSALGQRSSTPKSSASAPPPFYRISFRRGAPVAGVSATGAVVLPYECTNDGTAFVNMVIPASPDGQPAARSPHFSKYSPPTELVSISESGEAHDFRLDQLDDFYDIQERGYFASDSNVAFLIRAAREDQQGKQSYVVSDGSRLETNRNVADHHMYLAIFDRGGTYKKSVLLDETFVLQQVGVFPSGTLLSLGFDKQDHAPKVVLLKDDGTLLRILDVPKNAAPDSMLANQNGKGPAVYVKRTQLVPHGKSIILVQNKESFPLLEVNEAGEIRTILPKLPQGMLVNEVIPSDQGLYVQINAPPDGLLDEISEQDGVVLRRFRIEAKSPYNVACVRKGSFLSFDFGDGKLVPVTGTAEPAPDPDPAKPTSSPANTE